MTPQLQSILAWVSVAMPALLAFAHGLKALARAVGEHAATTADKGDDAFAAKLIKFADGLDRVVSFVAHMASGGLLRGGRE